MMDSEYKGRFRIKFDALIQCCVSAVLSLLMFDESTNPESSLLTTIFYFTATILFSANFIFSFYRLITIAPEITITNTVLTIKYPFRSFTLNTDSLFKKKMYVPGYLYLSDGTISRLIDKSGFTKDQLMQVQSLLKN